MNSLTTTPPPTGTTTLNGDQNSGQLIIKAQLGDDIRKMMIHNEDLTLNELLLMMERIFSGKISNSDEITIKYLDEEGDKITLLNDTDLTVALHFHKLLRLFVFVNGQEQPATDSSNATETNEKSGHLIDAKTFRSELQQIRNAVQTILDRLQLPAETNQEKEVTSSSSINASIGGVQATSAVTQQSTALVSSTAREFDPIKNATQFQPPQQRSSTPDSIRSKSSTSHLSGQNEQKTLVPTNASVPSESLENQHAPPTSTFGQTQMPTHFVPPTFVNQSSSDQQLKSNAFGPPPTTGFPSMTAPPPRFPNAFPGMTSASPSAFNPMTATPPPPSAVAQMPGQPSSFIGQQQQHPPLGGPPQQHQQHQQQQQHHQQQQQQPGSYFNPQAAAPPPTQGGLFQQQATFQQQRPPASGFHGSNPPPTAFGQPNATPLAPPPSSSSPAMITPSSIQPPPMASQQPYGYPPQNYYSQQAQQYPKAI